MTTGSVPQFIDVILNFASQKVTEDSWLQRAKEAGKGIVFFGDNTWLKLYPNMFLRSDGTTSFYVNDYKEVFTIILNLIKIVKLVGEFNLVFPNNSIDH